MNRILFVCNTYAQVIFATQMTLNLFKKDEITILISDHSNNATKYVKNAKCLSNFKNVYITKDKDFCYNWKGFYAKAKRFLLSFFRLFIGHTCLRGNENFNEIICYNADMATRFYFRYCNNKNIICSRMEEGILSYNYVDIPLPAKHKLLLNLSGLNDYCKNQKNMYCTYPELYKGPLETVKIPLMDPNNAEFVNAVSTIFGVEKEKLSYPQKYIFFSSVLDFEGGETVGELELAKKVAELVGRENLLVKVHPRDDVKRFIEAGLTVDQNSSVPWEAIQLNYDFSKHVFITVCSGSVLSISSVIPNPPRTVFAYKLVNTAGNQCALNTVKTLDEFRSSLGDKIKLDFIEVAEKLEDIV